MRAILAVIIIIVVLVVGKIFFFTGEEQIADKKGAAGPAMVNEKAKAMPVDIYLAKLESVSNEIFASGTMVANEEVELKSETSGRLTRLDISEGALITKGQLIAKINDADIQAKLKKVRYERELATQILARQKSLLNINAISKEEYDIVVNKVNTLSADKEALQVALAQTEVRAPFSGRIGLKYISVGAYLTPTITIATLVQTNPIKMDFSIPEKYSSHIKKGKTVQFSQDGSNTKYSATILAIDPKIDESLRTLKVRSTAPNKEGKFMPGMFVKVSAPLEKTESIMVPSQILIPFVGGKKLYVLKNGMAEERSVTTGLRTEDMVEVIEGVSVGDSLVASGLMSLKKGQALRASKVLN